MKKILLIMSILFFSVFQFSNVYGIENVNIKTNGIVVTEKLKLRSGISFNNECIKKLDKGEEVYIYDIVDNWCIIRTSNNLVGAVCADYIEMKNNSVLATSNMNNDEITADEKVFLNLINNERLKNNLPEYIIDEKIQNIARLKCKDLVEENYFTHHSKKYGTLYDMLNLYKINFNIASENIAKNSNVENVVRDLMESEDHRKNILSVDFKYTGLSIYPCVDGSNMYVEIFSY